MLNDYAYRNIELIKTTAQQVWGNDVTFGDVEVIDSPYPACQIILKVYLKHNVLLEYETSTFALKLWTGKKYEYLDKYTSEKIYYGFDSMKLENLLHNFQVLDRLLKKQKA